MRSNNNVDAARDLRQRMTPAEDALWRLLRDRRLAGHKFRRQHPVGPYVLDVCCAGIRLAIELDGSVHDNQQVEDAARTRNLEQSGYRIVRFSNADVLRHPDAVLAKIIDEVRSAAI